MPVDVSAEEPRKYLLRVENPFSFSAPLSFVSDSYLGRHEQRTALILGIYFGLAGLAAAWMFRAGLLALVPESIDVPVTPDVRVLVFAFVLTVAAAESAILQDRETEALGHLEAAPPGSGSAP